MQNQADTPQTRNSTESSQYTTWWHGKKAACLSKSKDPLHEIEELSDDNAKKSKTPNTKPKKPCGAGVGAGAATGDLVGAGTGARDLVGAILGAMLEVGAPVGTASDEAPWSKVERT